MFLHKSISTFYIVCTLTSELIFRWEVSQRFFLQLDYWIPLFNKWAFLSAAQYPQSFPNSELRLMFKHSKLSNQISVERPFKTNFSIFKLCTFLLLSLLVNTSRMIAEAVLDSVFIILPELKDYVELQVKHLLLKSTLNVRRYEPICSSSFQLIGMLFAMCGPYRFSLIQ